MDNRKFWMSYKPQIFDLTLAKVEMSKIKKEAN